MTTKSISSKLLKSGVRTEHEIVCLKTHITNSDNLYVKVFYWDKGKVECGSFWIKKSNNVSCIEDTEKFVHSYIDYRKAKWELEKASKLFNK